MDLSSPSPRSRASGNASAFLRAAVTVVLVILVIAAVSAAAIAYLAYLARRAPRPSRPGAGGLPAAPRRRLGGAHPAARNIFRLDPCCTPWARYTAREPPRVAREGFCSGYGDNMWGGASERENFSPAPRENFSPDAPGACSGGICAWKKGVAAAQLELGALLVADGRV